MVVLGLSRSFIKDIRRYACEEAYEQTEEALLEVRRGSRESDDPQSAKRCRALLHRCRPASVAIGDGKIPLPHYTARRQRLPLKSMTYPLMLQYVNRNSAYY